MDKYFPTWTLPEDHPVLAAGAAAYRAVTGQEPEVTRWNFSTNGVTITGVHGIPCLGFGPGPESVAHTANEWVPVSDLATACAFYAALPGEFTLAEYRDRKKAQ